jgi:WD40 repeat protein
VLKTAGILIKSAIFLLLTVLHGEAAEAKLKPPFEFSPDGTLLAAENETGALVIYDVATGDLVHEFDDAIHGFAHIAWSHDGHRIAINNPDIKVIADTWRSETQIWCVDRRKAASCPFGYLLTSIKADEYALDMAWSPDGTQLASVSQMGATVRIWDPNTSALLAEIRRGDPFVVAWKPDGTQLAGTDFMGGAWIIDSSLNPATWRFIDDFGRGKIQPAFNVEWSPDGNYLAIGRGAFVSGAGAGQLDIWDMREERFAMRVPDLGSMVGALAWSPNSRYIAVAAVEKNAALYLFDVTSGMELEKLATSHRLLLNMHWIWDGKQYVCCGVYSVDNPLHMIYFEMNTPE